MTTRTPTWEHVAFATGEGDHDEAAAGVRPAYRQAGLREPEAIVRLASPAAGAIAAAWLHGTGEVRAAMEETGFGPPGDLDGVDPGLSVRHEVRTAPWESARAEASAAAGPVGWARLWEETGGRLWPRVDRLVSDIRKAAGDLGGDVARRAPGPTPPRASRCGSSGWSGWPPGARWAARTAAPAPRDTTTAPAPRPTG
ncbi:hypothetical protein GCM10010116_50010 [Microbispora rosea subsp. aerata]|nr:hypothetical protein GCM10010116_50010 [Microbispora rosea subsp. aerata]GIH57989.1 hypothetical protein Mro02_49030 [Microbispora rosea subsp. aerata]GLJ81486.1 hypothetical protein GCM10017588_02100 [Microbispora rosea subsp. aerata]